MIKSIRFLLTAFFLLIGCIFLPNALSQHNPGNLEQENIRFGRYYLDKDRKLTLKDIASPNFGHWRLVGPGKQNWGFNSGTLWLRFTVEPYAKDHEKKILDLGFHFFTKANLYIIAENKTGLIGKAGKEIPFENRAVRYRNPAFVLPNSEVSQDFILELETPAVMKVPARIVTWSRLLLDDSKPLFAVYVGILLGLSIYHLILGVLARERVYIFYTVYAISTLLTIMDIEGYAYEYLWHHFSWWYPRSATVFATISGIAGLLFVKEYVKAGPNWRKIIYGTAIIQLLFLAWIIGEASSRTLMMSHYVLFLAVVVALVFAARSAMQLNKAAILFLMAFGLFALGLLVFTLQNLGVLPYSLLGQHGIAFGQSAEIMLLSIGLSARINDLKSEAHAQDVQAKILSAKAEAARWFAHEVRRPYQLLLVGLENLSRVTDKDQLNMSIGRLTEKAKVAYQRLNDMASNLVLGQTDRLELSQINIEATVERSLDESSAVFQNSNIDFIYDFRSARHINCDVNQISRVFSNLITNAVEAMGGSGEICFESYDFDQVRVAVAVHNTNSFIENNDLEKIFESGFSKGKTGGFGLGLAMVKRVVERHEGEIRVSSERNEDGCRTSFIVILPSTSSKITEDLGQIKLHLPKNSSDLPLSREEGSKLNESVPPLKGEELKILVTGMDILIIEDDAQYRNELLEMFSHCFPECAIAVAINDGEALEMIKANPKLIICDVELYGSRLNGFEIVDKIRGRVSSYICIHSGIVDERGVSRAHEVGADEFLGKPMLIESALSLLDRAGLNGELRNGAKKVVISLDDEPDEAKLLLSEAVDFEVVFFDDPDKFLDWMEDNVDMVGNIDLILTDYYFKMFNVVDVQLARSIRKRGYHGRIVLFSNAPLGPDFKGPFDKFIQKKRINRTCPELCA